MISIEHSFIIRQRSVKKESLYIQGLFGLVKIKRTINQWLRESERARVSKGTVDKRDEGDANRFRLGGGQLIIRFSCVLLRGTVMLRMPEASRILSFLLFSFSPLPYSSFPPFSFSPFFLGPTRLFFALSRLRSCLFSGSRSGIAWRPVLPCAMPYPTTRLTIEENLRRFRSCYRRI